MTEDRKYAILSAAALLAARRLNESGGGVERNYALAAEWYLKAAEHVPNLGGAGQGRNNLGLLYMDGLGVPKDYVQAYMWFSLAGTETNLAAVQDEMTPARVLRAQQTASEWKKSHPDPRFTEPLIVGLDCRKIWIVPFVECA